MLNKRNACHKSNHFKFMGMLDYTGFKKKTFIFCADTIDSYLTPDKWQLKTLLTIDKSGSKNR